MLRNSKICWGEKLTGMHDQPNNHRTNARQSLREHLSGYQRRDYEVVDYQMFELPKTRLYFRGPQPGLTRGQYFTCVGAAQTLGCFCDQPFPTLLSNRIGLPVLNLGYGGAGPEFFERHESLDAYINAGQFLILQVMSGRSQSNSIFEGRGLEYLRRRSDGLALSSDEGYRDLLFGIPELRNAAFGQRTPELLRVLRRLLPRLGVSQLCARPKVRRIVEETRRAWVESHKHFLSRIRVPVILFWFSRRPVYYVEGFSDIPALFGEFPQLVNSRMVEQIIPLCERYIECISSKGSPQLLKSRFTGEPVMVDTSLDRPDFKQQWTHNNYYPTPDMHEDAFKALYQTCACMANLPREVT